MKLSMSSADIQQLRFHEKKLVMADWQYTSQSASKLSWISVAFSFVAALTMRFLLKDTFFFMYLGSFALYLIGALFSKKWSIVGYSAILIAEVLTICRFNLGMWDNELILVMASFVSLFGLLPSFYAFRCMCNYKTVFKELEKCEGFPNFIANTADLYGDKLYIHDEENTVYESRKEASYNPFNSEDDVIEEEVRRYQDAKVKAKKKPIEMDLTVDGKIVTRAEIEKARKAREKEAKKGGLFIGRFELVFPIADLNGNDFDRKRAWMYKWRDNNDLAVKNFVLFAFLLMVGILGSGFGSFKVFFDYLVIAVFIMGTNQMKMGKWYAPLTLFAATMYTVSLTAGSIVSFIFTLAAFAVNYGLIIAVIRYILNYKTYKALSEQEGFPSFIRTTADLYADKIYIVDKKEPIADNGIVKRQVKIMNIGYDEKPKKNEGAWNAFDYMDKKDDENES